MTKITKLKVNVHHVCLNIAGDIADSAVCHYDKAKRYLLFMSATKDCGSLLPAFVYDYIASGYHIVIGRLEDKFSSALFRDIKREMNELRKELND